jgi:protein-S-isoprenylcysteine O-methyltransferase Ste14
MSRWGVGPVFAAGSIALVATLSAINIFFLPTLTLSHNLVAFILGTGLMATGTAVLVVVLVQVHSAFGNRRLVTDGVYACMRDPVYAVWILLIVPGLALATGVLLVAIAPFLMYLLFKALIGKEEAYLEMTFGKEYLDYKKKVNSVIPKLLRRTKK